MSNEQRNSQRVPLNQPAIIRLRRQGAEANLTGRAINMSSSGLLFECDEDLNVGQQVEVSVLWPAKHNGKTELKLVVSGRIVRHEGSRAVVGVSKKEFRTAGRSFGSSAD